MIRLNRLLDRGFIKRPRLRRFVTRMLFGSKTCEVELLGAGLTVHSEYENGYLRAFRGSRRLSLFRDEAANLINLAALIEDGTSFVDAGANIGIYSATLSRLKNIRKDFAIFAFEADPRTYARLVLNAARHGFVAENVALAERDGEMEFVRGAVSHVTTRAEDANSYSIAGETFSVGCRPLASFDIPGSAIVIKVDVEGAEYEVLLGAQPWFEGNRVKAVYFDGIARLPETLAFLRQYGFSCWDGTSLGPLRNPVKRLMAVRSTDLPRNERTS